MLLFFTPNPCIERTLRVPDFAALGSFRVAPADVRVTAGGKGINAARVAANLGADVLSLAPVGPAHKTQLQAFLDADGVRCEWVEVAAATRATLNVVQQSGVTEIVEAGGPLSLDEGAALIEAFAGLLPRCEFVVIGGSYPAAAPGWAQAWERHGALLCELARRAARPIFYDGNGPAWKRAVQSASPPWAIKPNLREASELLNRKIETPAQERAAVRELMQRGVAVVLLSCGARGLWLGHNGTIEWLGSPTIREVSAVGSGDALVGAFAAKWSATGDIGEAARWGVAAGAANAAQLEAARVTLEDVASLVVQVKRETVEFGLGALQSDQNGEIMMNLKN